MERLTRKLPDGRNILTGNFAYVRNPKYGSFVEGYAVEKLADYEDAEEQGLLLRLPCKVGDTVYLINHSICETKKTPLKCIVDEFTFDKDNRCYAVLNGAMNFYALRRFKAVDVNKFGLTIFLTKEEAEKALKRMESK